MKSTKPGYKTSTDLFVVIMNVLICKNWRGVPLLSVKGKILCRITIDRIRSGVDDRLRKEQAGYRRGSETTEQVNER